MVHITFIESHGEKHEADLSEGTTLMDGAISHDVEGIVAECGGACACATCHCYIEEAWLEKLDPAEAMEAAMLESVIDPKPNSRLSCQITVTSDMDGMIIYLPEDQI